MSSKAEPNKPNAAVAAESPLCAAPDPKPGKPRVEPPPLACDTHAHTRQVLRARLAGVGEQRRARTAAHRRRNGTRADIVGQR
ncbi:MAG: hypothetical protein HY525_08010 [Betaproteobacteria bacterium]|nr:hypothetical protein [Betaproteobacteria bacterium]